MNTPAERFWSKVLKTATCWLWQGSKNENGYGVLTLNQRRKKAHRMSWFLAKGEWPKLHILHKCDNPSCVNPSHLFEGTHSDNLKDCASKGRLNSQRGNWSETVVSGEKHYLSKLTNEQVINLVKSFQSSGMSIRRFHRQAGVPVTYRTLHNILTGFTWSSVTGIKKSGTKKSKGAYSPSK